MTLLVAGITAALFPMATLVCVLGAVLPRDARRRQDAIAALGVLVRARGSRGRPPLAGLRASRR